MFRFYLFSWFIIYFIIFSWFLLKVMNLLKSEKRMNRDGAKGVWKMVKWDFTQRTTWRIFSDQIKNDKLRGLEWGHDEVRSVNFFTWLSNCLLFPLVVQAGPTTAISQIIFSLVALFFACCLFGNLGRKCGKKSVQQIAYCWMNRQQYKHFKYL